MRTLTAASLFLLASLSGPALAETPVKATPADACPLSGPLSDTNNECASRRIAYQTQINDCVDRLRSEADAAAGRRTSLNAHTSRARFLICDSETRLNMAPRSD